MTARKKKAPPNTAEVSAKAVQRYRVAKEAAKNWAEVEATARRAIEEALGENEVGTVDGEPVVFWKHGKRTALSQALLAELYPDVLEECKATTPTRTMTLAKLPEAGVEE